MKRYDFVDYDDGTTERVQNDTGRYAEYSDVAPLVEAVRELMSHRVGDLPNLGYIRDNDNSRKSIWKLASVLEAIDAQGKD